MSKNHSGYKPVFFTSFLRSIVLTFAQMKKFFPVLIFLLAGISAQAQTGYPSKIHVIDNSTWKLTLDTITATEFDKTKALGPLTRQTNSDSLLNVLTTRHPNAITRSDSCCTLLARDTVLRLCHKIAAEFKGSTGFKAIGIDHGFLLLEDWGYETWSFTGFNPQTRQYFLLFDEPRFIGSEFVYSAGNYYGEGQFQIWNLKTNKMYGFVLYNWELTAFYRNDNSILFELTSSKEKKYLRVRYRQP